MVRIVNWNIKRLEDISPDNVVKVIDGLQPDIVVLTETSNKIKLKGLDYVHFSTSLPNQFDGISYKDDEVRTAIYSRYPIIECISLNDSMTNCAANLLTPFGHVIVYATVIGVFGNRGNRFTFDLDNMISDIESLPGYMPMIVAGDFNQSFSDNYYFTNIGRQLILEISEKRSLSNLTIDLPQNVDHILISNELVSGKDISKQIFNVDKSMSDHIGIVVDIY